MLETKRLLLRNLCPADVDGMLAYRKDPQCSAYQRYEATSREALRRFVETYESSRFLSLEEEQHYAIVFRETGEIMGDFSLFYTGKDNCFTLGITIAPDFQKQGYGHELLKAVTERLREAYPTVDIVALIEKENVASIALARKLDFVEECYAESIGSYVFVIYGEPKR